MKFVSLAQIREYVDVWCRKKRFEKDEQEALSNLAASLKIVCDRAVHSANNASDGMGALYAEPTTSTWNCGAPAESNPATDLAAEDVITAPDTRTQMLNPNRHFSIGTAPSTRTFVGNEELLEKQVYDIRRISDVVEEINGYMVEWRLTGVKRFQVLSILISYCIDLMGDHDEFAMDVLECFNQMK